MSPPDPPKLSDETIRLTAEEVIQLPTTKAQRDGLRQILDGLLAEIRLVRLEDREGAEPPLIYAPGDWTP